MKNKTYQVKITFVSTDSEAMKTAIISQIISNALIRKVSRNDQSSSCFSKAQPSPGKKKKGSRLEPPTDHSNPEKHAIQQ